MSLYMEAIETAYRRKFIMSQSYSLRLDKRKWNWNQELELGLIISLDKSIHIYTVYVSSAVDTLTIVP